MAGQPKAPFYVAVFLVIAGLVAFAAYRAINSGPKPPKPPGPDVVLPGPQPGPGPGPAQPGPGNEGGAEAPDTVGITTVKEYSFKPSERLPAVKGTAAYKPMQDNTVRFALNVWAGWAPIIFANNGFQAGKVWKTPDGQDFKVELVLIDNPIEMRDSYAAGDVHIGWATLDMLPLFVDGFVDRSGQPKDSRVMPRVYQQVDWSNGGDGIVVRESIKTVSDLRGKTIALAENSPSHYFLLNMLVSGGVQPAEVKLASTGTAFEAAAAFNADKNIAACVSWAPDIYNLSKVKGNRMLVSTATANKLIADVWFARADFAQDHPGIVEGLVRGIFDGMADLKTDANKQKVAELMATGYGLPPADALGMLGDAHSTNWGENYQFFVNQNNPTNFARVWAQSYYLYRSVRAITNTPVPFDQVMDYSIIAKLGGEEKYRSQKDEYGIQFAPKPTAAVRGEEEILTNTVIIHFYPNSWEIFKKITKDQDGKTLEVDYDPKAKYVIDEIGKLAGQFGNARIIIEGHTDSSMKGKIPDAMVKELSLNRANSVKEEVIKKFNFDPNKFNVEGFGWDVPADPTDPENQAQNRRVEVKVFTAEAG
ncbi:MAG: phosphate ABC transporter substrate-binding/OmpA family protein [Pirellulaceae bacterium]|nr:phosphate ABC transporter substrate-binding/OmpA family protein [Pirellulaceae bacterium]